MASHETYLSGPERLEPLPALGRPMRMGAASALRVSEAEHVRELLRAGNGEAAAQHLEYLHGLNGFMYAVTGEWAIRWYSDLRTRFGAADGLAIFKHACELWRSATTEQHKHEAAAILLSLLAPEPLDAALTRGETPQALAGQIVAQVNAHLQSVQEKFAEAIGRKDFSAALSAFEMYFTQARAAHDSLCRLLWALPSAVNTMRGQAAAEAALDASWAACSFQDFMWQFFGSLSPLARAAFMAEHLRSHYSGVKREGSVEIIEEADRFRLVLDPCGSGGAMRREGTALTKFETPSSFTWGRAGEVPAYCTHCAVNEVTSISKFGYPLWVTEFDLDASRPCGWTIFKDPKTIPAIYFERLGAKRASN